MSHDNRRAIRVHYLAQQHARLVDRRYRDHERISEGDKLKAAAIQAELDGYMKAGLAVWRQHYQGH